MAGIVQAKNPRAGNQNLNVDDKVYPTTQISIYDESGAEIGWISDLNETQSRPVEPIRHLNSDDAGRIVQGVPKPADFTLSVTGFAIYKRGANDGGSLAARLIANSGNPHTLMKSLEEQKIPFRIKKKVINPGTEGDTITVYHGCWITNYNNPTSVNNAFVTETADIFVSFVDEA